MVGLCAMSTLIHRSTIRLESMGQMGDVVVLLLVFWWMSKVNFLKDTNAGDVERGSFFRQRQIGNFPFVKITCDVPWTLLKRT